MSDSAFLARLFRAFRDAGHSIFSPSGSAMWMGCSGSLIPNLLADDSTSYEAAEGTVAHGVAERWLIEGKAPRYLIDTVEEVDGFEVTITEEMFDHLLDYVLMCQCTPGESFVEHRVTFDRYMPAGVYNQGGTMDHSSLEPRTLWVDDLKYGKNVPVVAKDNSQVRIYAIGEMERLGWPSRIKEVRMRINQPRLTGVTEDVISVVELREYTEYLRERAAAAWDIHAPRRVSPKGCQWCKVMADCPAMASFLLDRVTQNAMDDDGGYFVSTVIARLRQEYKLRLRATEKIQIDDMAVILDTKPLVMKYYDRLQETIMDRIAQGKPCANKKRVTSRFNRDWINQRSAMETLELIGVNWEDIFKTEMKSPAAVEDLLVASKMLKRKEAERLVDKLIIRQPGPPTLVNITDPRPSLDDELGQIWDDDDIL